MGMGLENITEDMLWFFAIFFFTVPPVLRFRENYMVPLLATLLVFGFYTQAFWMPDFYVAWDWIWIAVICICILIAYFLCGWIIHYFWGKNKSVYLKDIGAFKPLFNAWIFGKHYQIEDDYIIEIRRLRLFEVAFADVAQIEYQFDAKPAIVSLRITDGIEREKEILSEFCIDETNIYFVKVCELIKAHFPDIDANWLDNAQNSGSVLPVILFQKK